MKRTARLLAIGIASLCTITTSVAGEPILVQPKTFGTGSSEAAPNTRPSPSIDSLRAKFASKTASRSSTRSWFALLDSGHLDYYGPSNIRIESEVDYSDIVWSKSARWLGHHVGVLRFAAWGLTPGETYIFACSLSFEPAVERVALRFRVGEEEIPFVARGDRFDDGVSFTVPGQGKMHLSLVVEKARWSWDRCTIGTAS